MDLTLDTIHQGDCIEVMRSLPAGCADLVFADPPYNLQLTQELHRPDQSHVDAVDDHWDRFASFAEYDRFTEEWLSASRHVLKDTGTIWVIGTYHNIYRVGAILQNLGYWLLNDVVFIKNNPMPQFRGVRFCNAHETLLWAKKSKDQRPYTFHYHALKAGNDDLQMRSDWYLPICQGRERLRHDGSKVHATQKPEALLWRILRACTSPGDVVLDPFFGSGTTGAVAKRLGRHYIGIEREAEYVEAACRRIAHVTPVPPEALLETPGRREARVPFAALVEAGLLVPGQRLRLRNRGLFAIVQANGTIASNGVLGSIHRVGAQLQNQPACNGWQAWEYEDAATGGFRSIDELRGKVRREMAEPAACEDTDGTLPL